MKKQQKLERVGRFVTPDLPVTDADGVTTYKLKFVTIPGQQVEKPCTQQAYKDFLKHRPDMRTKYTFLLKIDSDGNVYDYNEVLAPPLNGMFRQEMADGRVLEAIDKLIFERRAGAQEWEAVFIPDMVQMPTVEAIMGALLKAGDHIEPQQQLLEKYQILEITQRAGMEVVTVDLAR